MANTLQCGTHGEREARFVCDHLFQNLRATSPQRLFYFEPEHAADEPTPAIWCGGCEAVIQREGEINAVVLEVANFRAVCDFCFQRYLDAGEPAPAEA
ncbi:hypothetical protein [Aquimonas sp.]|jgi:hypothetical protein|uniref:hypothetical protein n=1 Tax=Aquimonas sp. TaxID=1872588 RepID=UPI0037BFB0D6